jgi:uracil-DNA glycosylase
MGSTIPKDLIALYTEIQRVIPDFVIPTHGDLTFWALQGILLLNLSLTSTPGKPDNYGEIWLGFLMKILEGISKEQPKVPFILFGEKCKKIVNLISRQSLVICTSNPGYTMKFRESDCIVKLLENWKKHNIEGIDWNLKI